MVSKTPAIIDPKKINIIITDFNMPDLNRIELASAIKKIDASVPIILISGSEYCLNRLI
ncbi:hypothetical protein NEF87_002378 [Candidatus Lokiarchaeum ossiferum]|uniref:Response regulatory domain-containing protein n=1 Tax=Candidatus Lokiarchaeum ossiferum TaxID=2951803 RepID=A0ABY6HRG2_9ARCH|nr:hypothetical protein NEF87_002378 [Candidatus Lokiarchaeum sp. B-35]